jgi:aspartate kinase
MTSGTPVRVKNSYNPAAPGTLISNKHGTAGAPLIRAITSKKNVTLIDIVSTRMLGQYGFLEGVFSIFAAEKISIDVIATSEVSISLTVDSFYKLDGARKKLSAIADLTIKDKKAIVTIVGDVTKPSDILQKAFGVCTGEGVSVQMISQGASKHNISFIVNDDEAAKIVIALHKTFFEDVAA